jgi:hypothetical protein
VSTTLRRYEAGRLRLLQSMQAYVPRFSEPIGMVFSCPVHGLDWRTKRGP